jgi:predicted alpha/beta-fold hydrolase
VTDQTSFRPAWWLPGPHLPTVFGKLVRKVPPAHERMERWATPDGDHVSVAMIDPPTASAPILTIFHGLEGTIRSTYAQGLLHQARARGWGAAMLLWRSCDGRIPRAPRMYHSGETSDADFFFRTLHARFPSSPLLATGVSLGANVLLKWLGERAESTPGILRAAAAVSTPFDLGAGSRHLEQGFSRVYVRHFVRGLRRKALAALELHPTLPVERTRVATARTFWEFDDAFTAPVHGFDGADDYYARSSSLAFLEHIRRPALLFSAIDDPFLPAAVLDTVRGVARENSCLVPDFTATGGHVGWVSGSPFSPRYYMEAHVTSWLARHL